VIARLTAYRTPAQGVEPLVEEVVAVARSARPVDRTARRVELFLVDRARGDALSVLIGDDGGVAPAVELGRRPSAEPEEFTVHLLQVGGPKGSNVVDALFGRVVRCAAAAHPDLSFDGRAVPTSPDVWLRALLVAPDRELVLALAVASDRAALEESLRKFSARCPRVDDYDDVAYHFLLDDGAPEEHRG
jgi:hypothetical protein